MNETRDKQSEKALLRSRVFAARKAAHQAANGAGEAVRDHLLASRLLTGAEVVSGYCPIRTELDVMPAMAALADAGHRLCVPVIQGRGQALRFREWWPGAVMVDGPFGAEVPAGGDWLAPQLLLVPLVAFDAEGWRLGYGGGFYDRTLEGLRAERRTLALGIAYDAQEVTAVPREPTDQRLDAILTESGLRRFGVGAG